MKECGLKSAEVIYGSMETPIGSITVATFDSNVCRLSFDGNKPIEWELELWGKSCLGNTCRVIRDEHHVQPVLTQLSQYFAGERRQFDVGITFLEGTPFQRKVWQQLLTIPYGEVRTYKQIAQAIGMPKAVRAVGGANNKNPIAIIVPCHRVIGSNGALVGYGGGLDKKEYLLTLEGYLK